MLWKITIGNNVIQYWANAEDIHEAIVKAEAKAMVAFNDEDEEFIAMKATKAELFLSEDPL